MDTQILPAYGSHDDFSTRIEGTETLLFNALLLPTAADRYGARAVIVSRGASGLHWLRVCEGNDERWMRWTEQRRLRMQFGSSYAEALAQAWIARWERDGWKVEWSLRAEPTALAVAA
ncbi:hypothetical protein [Solimonas terrae]|uniref:Uncharacterized protein n=1 Tax=Solimonas terrae TaxID=1396819 RepID=A0A6M2BW92_9GAMM|nr:hypothetical protein [Solimonas terrae]NGY06471.1 hypothetical protein [Solimonas terrae]